MRQSLLLFSLLCLSLCPVMTPSQALAKGTACYSKAEAEADQAIRIHSELMVIGLNCQHMGKRNGENLYGDYRKFTANHGDLIAGYESTLIDYFRRTGSKNPVGALNALRTGYANKISNNAAKMRPDIFCSRYSPRIHEAMAMKRDDVRKWAATFHPSHPVSHPVCKS